jgi:hypothetical protein
MLKNCEISITKFGTMDKNSLFKLVKMVGQNCIDVDLYVVYIQCRLDLKLFPSCSSKQLGKIVE